MLSIGIKISDLEWRNGPVILRHSNEFGSFGPITPTFYIKAKSGNPSQSYGDLKFVQFGADPYIGFQGRWISFIARILQTYCSLMP